MENIFPIVFFGIILYFLYQMFSKGGFKGAIFGSKVIETVGEINLKKVGITNQILRVHKLENGEVGIEHTTKAVLGFSMTGFTITQAQAEELISQLRQTQ